ncbi:MAG: hypothetical protein RLZ51_1329, partial [Pseudomonadota bacterium]
MHLSATPPSGVARRSVAVRATLATFATLCACLVGLAIAPSAQAQGSTDADPRWSLIPTVGWVLADGDRRAG